MCKKRVSEGTEGKDPLVVMSSTDVVHLQEKWKAVFQGMNLGTTTLFLLLLRESFIGPKRSPNKQRKWFYFVNVISSPGQTLKIALFTLFAVLGYQKLQYIEMTTCKKEFLTIFLENGRRCSSWRRRSRMAFRKRLLPSLSGQRCCGFKTKKEERPNDLGCWRWNERASHFRLFFGLVLFTVKL